MSSEERQKQEMLKAIQWWDEVLKEMEKASESESPYITFTVDHYKRTNDPPLPEVNPEDWNIHLPN